MSCVPLPCVGDIARAVCVALERIRPDVVAGGRGRRGGDGRRARRGRAPACPIARLGAGLRCGDRNAAREINRIAIDELATRLYTDGEFADEQLVSEGVARAASCASAARSRRSSRAGVSRRCSWRRGAPRACRVGTTSSSTSSAARLSTIRSRSSTASARWSRATRWCSVSTPRPRRARRHGPAGPARRRRSVRRGPAGVRRVPLAAGRRRRRAHRLRRRSGGELRPGRRLLHADSRERADPHAHARNQPAARETIRPRSRTCASAPPPSATPIRCRCGTKARVRASPRTCSSAPGRTRDPPPHQRRPSPVRSTTPSDWLRARVAQRDGCGASARRGRRGGSAPAGQRDRGDRALCAHSSSTCSTPAPAPASRRRSRRSAPWPRSGTA